MVNVEQNCNSKTFKTLFQSEKAIVIRDRLKFVSFLTVIDKLMSVLGKFAWFVFEEAGKCFSNISDCHSTNELIKRVYLVYRCSANIHHCNAVIDLKKHLKLNK